MRWCLLTLALVACNQVFGLDPAQTRPGADAAYFDAPIDAPFACPPLGTAPRFSRILHQIDRDCTDYTESRTTDLATTLCLHATGYVIEQGPPGGPFSPSVGIAAPGLRIAEPRLAPEGDELFMVEGAPMGPTELVAYRLQADRTWQRAYVVNTPYTLSPFTRMGQPSRGPARRMMVDVEDGLAREIEFDSTGASREFGTYDGTQLGGAPYTESAPGLSPDGLRMIYDTYEGTGSVMRYADRPTVDVRFGTPVPLDGVPVVFDAFMAEDCSRVYFSAVSSLLWVQQL